jgi:hydrogenase maturation protease
MRVRVIGVGTPHGDDALGLAVVTRLAGAPLPAWVDLVACERPLPDLVDALEGVETVILVDALRPGRWPGRVHRLQREDLLQDRSLSTHGVGVAGALELAAVLGHVPRRLEIVAIETGTQRRGAASAASERGIEEAAALVQALARELASLDT